MPKKPVDWPYELRLDGPPAKLADACTTFTSPVAERLCHCTRKYNCDCLGGEGRRKMCRQQAETAEDRGHGNTAVTIPPEDNDDGDRLIDLLRGVQVLNNAVIDQVRHACAVGSIGFGRRFRRPRRDESRPIDLVPKSFSTRVFRQGNGSLASSGGHRNA